jgi:tetratricopeptide (TPR) repeat protein
MIPPDATWKPPVLLAAAAMIALSLSPDALGSRKSAVRSVREGVRSYRSGDYQAAGRAFDEADVALPENDVIAFNKACVHAARGDAEKAVELFEKAAISRDEKLAAGAHYNLGCVAVGRARSLFGDKPEEATADVRAQGLELLGQAVRHYRDCLQTNSSHAAARRNLEIIRLWIKHMREVWADRDRR